MVKALAAILTGGVAGLLLLAVAAALTAELFDANLFQEKDTSA